MEDGRLRKGDAERFGTQSPSHVDYSYRTTVDHKSPAGDEGQSDSSRGAVGSEPEYAQEKDSRFTYPRQANSERAHTRRLTESIEQVMPKGAERWWQGSRVQPITGGTR